MEPIDLHRWPHGHIEVWDRQPDRSTLAADGVATPLDARDIAASLARPVTRQMRLTPLPRTDVTQREADGRTRTRLTWWRS